MTALRRLISAIARPFVAIVRALLRVLWTLLRPVVRGLRATVGRLAPFLGPAATRVGRGATAAGLALAGALSAAGRTGTEIGGIAWYETARVLRQASLRLTPARTLTGGALVCALAIVIAQFSDYRVVLAGAAELDTSQRTAGSAHLYLLLPTSLLAAAAAWRLGTGDPKRLGRLLAGIGLLGIAVTLAIDLPTARDEGTYARDFFDTNTALLGAFYTQLLASATLAAIGLTATGLGRERPPVPTPEAS